MPDWESYELRWPVDLLRSEIAVLQAYHGTDWAARAEWLLTEAFADEQPAADFQAAQVTNWQDDWDPLQPALEIGDLRPQRQLLVEVANRADELRPALEPQPFWHQRKATAAGRQTGPDVRAAWAALVVDLQSVGYLGKVALEPCVDDGYAGPVDPILEAVIAGRLGMALLWPLHPKGWDDDSFYGLVEVIHDLIARPRARSYHSHNQCGWHYSAFAPAPGRALYRWRVNRLLERHGVPLRLADDGEDIGRLVEVVDEARAELLQRALASPPVEESVAHAVSLFRVRDATVDHKRSACAVLARILESRRSLIDEQLLRKDEGALFAIANGFDIRHSRADQHTDYDPMFLDWIFWWYLATVELTNRLLERNAPS